MVAIGLNRNTEVLQVSSSIDNGNIGNDNWAGLKGLAAMY